MRVYLIWTAVFMFLFAGITTVTVVIPALTFRPAVATEVRAFSELELRGRIIYMREGCYTCHSQQVRPQDLGMGPQALAQDFVSGLGPDGRPLNLPNLVGTLRTGPDLSNIGGIYPDEWHVAHLRNPRALLPASIMPSFIHLNNADMEALIAYLQSLGTRGPTPHYDVINAKLPIEFRERQNFIGYSLIAAGVGRGIFNQTCAVCHGFDGRGGATTPAGRQMLFQPANFTDAKYRDWTDQRWFYGVHQGKAGTDMPRFGLTLSDAQIWYLVAFLKAINKGDLVPTELTPPPELSPVPVVPEGFDAPLIVPQPPDGLRRPPGEDGQR